MCLDERIPFLWRGTNRELAEDNRATMEEEILATIETGNEGEMSKLL